ncbi:MAG: T9SS type A sorting domain-containing protein [Crocinitomicaceae bacterium]|nr:T9SS type A sorting domain-containing protein [Flavobacteriales bacterium]NQZ38219.1 T9SS type A sorting domain-containing protein [Crocinitomicaceae bacterium]PHR18692.1 MAG: hypothetical protein COA38_19975 [Fluviicola sp.]
MKKIITSIAICLSGFASTAQVGAVAPNFTADDINGTSQDLYAHLAAGKVVIVDMYATWCGPCWSFHTGHYLEDIYAEFGPNGTNEVVIIGYEDAQNTSLDDMYGTGSNTLGDWVTGVSYTLIHGPVVLPAEYGTGYPTVSVICPSDKKIKYNLFNSGTLQQMKDDVQDVITQCSSVSISESPLSIELSIAPNPVTDITRITFDALSSENAVVNVYSISGELVLTSNYNVEVGINSIELDLNQVEAGTYLLKVETSSSVSNMTTLVKM